MLRRTAVSLGFFSVVKEELAKLPAYLSFRAKESAGQHKASAAKTLDFLKGNSPNDTPEVREKRKNHKELYDAIMRKQQAQRAALAEKQKARYAALSWRERLIAAGNDVKESLQSMTSAKMGVMALLQHCTASHAAEVAMEQGIDVKNVQMVLEKRAKPNSVEYEEVVVGYIDAPRASDEEVFAFAEKLHKACPVANSMHVEWKHGSGTVDQQSSASDEELQRSGMHSFEWQYAGHADVMPTGTPGSRRIRSSSGAKGRESAGLSHNAVGEDEELHLPGMGTSKAPPKDSSAHDGMPGGHRAHSKIQSEPASSSQSGEPVKVPAADVGKSMHDNDK